MPKHNSSRASKSKPSGKGKKEETPACRKSREKNAELVLEILKNGMFTTYPRLPVVFARVTSTPNNGQRKLLLSTGETCMGTLSGSVSHGGWFPSGVGSIVLVEYNADAFSKLSYRTKDEVWLDIIAVPSEGDIEYVIKRSYSHFLPDWLLSSDDSTGHSGGGSFFDYSGGGAGGGATEDGIGAVEQQDMYLPSMGTKADKARRRLQEPQSVLANVVQAPQGNRGSHSNTGGGAGFREKDDEAEEIADIFKSVKLTAEHHREEAAKKVQKNEEKVKKMLENPDTPEGGEESDTSEEGEEEEEEEEP